MKHRAIISRPVLALAVGLTLFPALAAYAETTDTAPSVGDHLHLRVLAGGGVGQFVSSSARSVAEPSSVWQLRTVLATPGPFGAEVAYVGNVQDIRMAGTSRRAELFGHGVEAVLRLDTAIPRGHFRFEPFAFGGLGWTRYMLNAGALYGPRDRGIALEPFDGPRLRPNDALSVAEIRPTASFADRDDVFTIPVGGGLDVAYRRFILDARVTLRPAFGEDGLIAQPNGPADLGNWSASLALGYQF
jgi:hypothetical protein